MLIKKLVKRKSKITAIVLVTFFLTLSILPLESNISPEIQNNIAYLAPNSNVENSILMGQIVSNFSIGGEVNNYSNQLNSIWHGAMTIDSKNNCMYEASGNMVVEINIADHSIKNILTNKTFGKLISWMGFDNLTNRLYLSIMTNTPSTGQSGFIGSILCMNPGSNNIKVVSSNISCIGDCVSSYALYTNNNSLFYVENASVIMEMNLTTGTSIPVKLNFTPSNVCYIALSNNGNNLVFEDDLCEVVIDNVNSGSNIISPRMKGAIVDLSYDSSENRIFVKSQNTDNISVINASTGKISHVINMSSDSNGIEVYLPDQLLYFSSIDGNISVFNAISLKYEESINVPHFLISRGSQLNYACDHRLSEIFIGYTVENQIVPIKGLQENNSGVIYIGTNVSEGIFYNPYNNLLYVSTNDGNLIWYNPQNFDRIGKLYIGFFTKYFAVDTKTGLLYLADTESDSMYIINSSTSSIFKIVTVGSSPANIIFCSKTNDVYTLNEKSFNISVTTAYGKHLNSIPLLNGNLGKPDNMLYDSNNGKIYVSFEFPCDIQCVNLLTLNAPNTYITNSNNFIYDPITGNILVSRLKPWIPSTNTNSSPETVNAQNYTYVSDEYDTLNKNVLALRQNCLGETETLVIINGSTEFVEGNLTVGKCAQDLTVDTSNGMIYVSSSRSNYIENIKLFPEYDVRFSVTGFISSPSWYINMCGRPRNFTISNSYESIYLPNGTYKYSIGTSEIYTFSPQKGTIQVEGKAVDISVTFSLEYDKFVEYNSIYIIVISAIIISVVLFIWRKRR